MLNITNASADSSAFDSEGVSSQRVLPYHHPEGRTKAAPASLKDRHKDRLYQLIREADHDGIRQLLDSPKCKARVNSRDADRRTPLHEAVCHAGQGLDHTRIVRYLLKRGHANVNVHDVEGASPLHEAVRNDDAAMVELLVSYGAKVNAKDKYGSTPLHEAAHGKERAIVRALLDRGADVNALDEQFNSPLYEAACHGHVEAIELMLERGADPNWRNSQGGCDEFSSAFYQTLLTGDERAIQLFLDHGVNVNLRQYCNETALHLAVVHCHVGVLKKLLAKGVRIQEVTEEYRETALHWLLHYHRSDAEEAIVNKIALLMHHGTDVDARDRDDKTPLYYAVERKLSENVVNCLLEHGASVNGKSAAPLTVAISNGDLQLARLLMEHGAKTEYADKEKKTPLYHAIDCIEDEGARFEMAKELLDRGADANGCRAPNLLTPLQLAIRRSDLELVRLLLDSGASITAQVNGQEAPLCTAVKYDFYDAAELLISVGASIHVYSKKGKSLFSIAQSNRNQDMEMLLNKAL